MTSPVSPLLEALIVLILFGGLCYGAYRLWHSNQHNTARTQAMFGAGGSGTPAPQPGAPLATVVSKRTYNWPDRIGYYVTFQVEQQAPVELEVNADWYHFLAPGERGALTQQAGHFAGFHRAG